MNIYICIITYSYIKPILFMNMFFIHNKILHRNNKYQFTMSLFLRREKKNHIREDYSLNFTYALVFFLRKIASEYYLSPNLGFETEVFCVLVSKLSGIFKA